MLSCDAAHRLMARAADGDAGSPHLDAHLAVCPACRAAFAAQQQVVRTLQGREPHAVPLGFAARVAARLDEDARGGILDLVNWRAWTVRLAPLAAALVVAAYLGAGAGSTQDIVGESPAVVTATVEPTLDSWVTSAAADTPAAVFLHPEATADLLIETVLTGTMPAWSREAPGDGSVR